MKEGHDVGGAVMAGLFVCRVVLMRRLLLCGLVCLGRWVLAAGED